MPKTINESPDYTLLVDADSTTGAKVVTCAIRHEYGVDSRTIDVVAASQAAVAALASAGIVLTAAQVRQVWRQLAVQSLAQAKTAGGWS